MFKKIKTPCYECADRFLSCHQTCEKYKAWAESVKDRKTAIRESKKYRYLVIDYMREKRR